jgi:uncharacterized protein (TIGR03067 family)
MRTIAILMLAFGLARGDDDKVKKEMALMEGEWTLVSAVGNGKEMPEEQVKTGKRTVKGDESTVEIGGKVVVKAKFTIDPSQKVKTIDYVVLEGDLKDQKLLGIYELDGDTLKFCLAGPDGERPTKFESKEGSKHGYSVWKKAKK